MVEILEGAIGATEIEDSHKITFTEANESPNLEKRYL